MIPVLIINYLTFIMNYHIRSSSIKILDNYIIIASVFLNIKRAVVFSANVEIGKCFD